MLRDCMYSSDESDLSDIEDEEAEIREFEQSQRTIRKIMEKECIFFERVMSYPFLWRFKNSQSYNANEWIRPNLKRKPMEHFYDQFDEMTMRSIQIGIGLTGNYSLYSHEKKYHFTRDELTIIFKLAADWMNLKNLGHDNYVNELCWVASKIMFVQVGN